MNMPMGEGAAPEADNKNADIMAKLDVLQQGIDDLRGALSGTEIEQEEEEEPMQETGDEMAPGGAPAFGKKAPGDMRKALGL